MLIRKSIKNGLLILILGLIIISMSIMSYLGVDSILILGENAGQTTSIALKDQAESFLIQLMVSSAEKNDNMLEDVRKDASNLASYAAGIFDNPEAFAGETYWNFDEHVFMGEHGQYMNGPDDISSLFIPNHVVINDNLKNRVELGAYLDHVFPKFLENNPNIVAMWTIGHEQEARYYPNIGLGNIEVPDKNLHEEVFFTVANPDNNPNREVVWTPLYDDPAGQGLMITASAPIYTEEGFFGVLGIDVTLEAIVKNIEEYNPIEQSYAFLIDNEGYSIALPGQAYKDILGRAEQEGESRTDLNNVTNEFYHVLGRMKEGSTGFESVLSGDKELYVAYAPLKGTGFSLGIVVEEAVMLKAVIDMQKEIEESTQNLIYLRLLPIGLMILIITVILSFLLTNKVIGPIKKLTAAAGKLSKGNFDVKADIGMDNEIGQLASSFNKMVFDIKGSRKKIDEYSKSLEKKVAERTKELDAKVRELTDTKTAVLNMMEDMDQTNKELIESQEDLKSSLRELKEMDVNKNQFISVAAHELKTPLTSIHGFSQLLQDRKIANNFTRRNKYLKIMDHETKRLAKLVNDMLDLSRIDLGTIKLNQDKTDINKVIGYVKREMSVQIKERGLESKYDVEKGLQKIVTDREKLTEILINLINNAVKYTPKGKITVNVFREGSNVHFTVKDTGIGIAKEYQEKIFERFYQVDSSYTRKAGGTGLGLSLCSEFVNMLGGKIWVNSKEGEGSEFHFTLPIKGVPKKYVRGEKRRAEETLKKSEELRKRLKKTGAEK